MIRFVPHNLPCQSLSKGRHTGGCLSSGYRNKARALLLEVPVVGEKLSDAALSHRVHRNAIGQTVTFVRPRPIQFQPGEKRFTALGNNRNGGILDQAGYICARLGSDVWTRAREKSPE